MPVTVVINTGSSFQKHYIHSLKIKPHLLCVILHVFIDACVRMFSSSGWITRVLFIVMKLRPVVLPETCEMMDSTALGTAK